MTQPVDRSILQEIVRVIEAQRKVPERVVVRSREYVITYLEDHMNRLQEALRRYDSDRLNMLYGQLASKVKYQMQRMSAGRSKAPAKEAAGKAPAKLKKVPAPSAPAVRAAGKAVAQRKAAARGPAKPAAKRPPAKGTAAKQQAKKPAARKAATKKAVKKPPAKPTRKAAAKKKAGPAARRRR